MKRLMFVAVVFYFSFYLQIAHSENEFSLQGCLEYLEQGNDWIIGNDVYMEKNRIDGGGIVRVFRAEASEREKLNSEEFFYKLEEFLVGSVVVSEYGYLYRGEERYVGVIESSNVDFYMEVSGNYRDYTREFIGTCRSMEE